jgi:hypothetical protein
MLKTRNNATQSAIYNITNTISLFVKLYPSTSLEKFAKFKCVLSQSLALELTETPLTRDKKSTNCAALSFLLVIIIRPIYSPSLA